jgi:nitrate/nitrite transport system ATP-binding protein
MYSSTQTQTNPNTRTGFLEVENLVKSYPTNDGDEFVVLDRVNLVVNQGEYISIIGHSGCGKSTLLKIVAGLEKATSGLVCLEGKEIRKPGADRMMVFQQYSLLPWLTVQDNIRLAVDEVYKKTSSVEKKEIVSEHLAMVNLTAAANKYPDEISGGMKQRVGIARALAVRPKLLLMDEPFGALDALTKGKLHKQVLKICEEFHQTAMMITHDVDEAIFLSDRIILMSNGPKANIGEIIEVPFQHPRDSHQLRESQEYYDIRNHALDFLDRHFTSDD